MTSIRTVILATICASSLSACGSTTSSTQFFGPAAPNNALGNYLEEAPVGERIGVTQHTGRLSIEDPDFGDGDFPAFMGSSLEATADGADRNAFDFEADDEGILINIARSGPVPMARLDEGDDGVFILLGISGDQDGPIIPDDDIVFVMGSSPFPNEPRGDLPLDYMSIMGWLAVRAGEFDDTAVSAEFGVGHFGLRTPDADMPLEGEATYDGLFVGALGVPGEGAEGGVGSVVGDAEITALFGDGLVFGEIRDTELVFTSLNGDTLQPETFNDIDFEATITGSTYAGTALTTDGAVFGNGSAGPADGVFYGPVEDGGPAETGVVLTIYNNEAPEQFLTGVVGAELDVGLE